MKKLSTYLLLIFFSFSAPSFADDLSEYQIEGISIGDSTLDFFSEEEIKNNLQLKYFPHIKDKKFILAEFYKFPFFQIYDSLQTVFKTNDKKYKIYGIHGAIFYDESIDDCYKKMDEIAEELSEIFKNAERNDFQFLKNPSDKSDKSTYSGVTFYLKKGIASVHCYDWSKDMPYTDNLRINLKSQKFEDWLWTD